MAKIENIDAMEILDSRGNPTLHVTLSDSSGNTASASVPSGASTGQHEAVELRDQDPKRYGGKGVLKAISNVKGPLAESILGFDPTDQKKIDRTLIEVDGTENKARMGANAILGISLAAARLKAKILNLPLYASIVEKGNYSLPVPMVNIINGGEHASNGLDFQEFMIRPSGIASFKEQVRASAEIFHALKKLLQEKGHSVGVGDEGGFAPDLGSHREALQFIMRAIEKAGYRPGEEITLALDCAASEFYSESADVYLEKKKRERGQMDSQFTPEEIVENLIVLCDEFPIDSIEDGLDQNDWRGWKHMNSLLGSKMQIVGDDLFVTNPKFLQKGIDEKAANAILIKCNQIGTLTETLDTIALAKKNGFATVISHRSGETEDPFIADLAVATDANQIKTGSMSRSERLAKYNRLLEIEISL